MHEGMNLKLQGEGNLKNWIKTLNRKAADAAAHAADAAYADAAAAAAAAARRGTLAKCADIVREHYPEAPQLEG